MGDYFIMSVRFNKHTASDFGLIPFGTNDAINPNDGSRWRKRNLYDFGWGAENGYYKLPLPGFQVLLGLVLHSADSDDMYGAASIILEKYPAELLNHCEIIVTDPKRNKELEILAKVFKLDLGTNRSPVTHKSYNEIQNDFERWQRIAKLV